MKDNKFGMTFLSFNKNENIYLYTDILLVRNSRRVSQYLGIVCMGNRVKARLTVLLQKGIVEQKRPFLH